MQVQGPHAARLNRVLSYIDAHLARPLDLTTLAGVANFLPWHFHRVFLARTGETVADYTRRRRLETAALRLMLTTDSALAAALDVGFGSAEVFTRAFSAHFGVTPSAWRLGAYRMWAARQRTRLRKIHQAQRKHHQDFAAALSDLAAVWPSRAITVTGVKSMSSLEVKIFPDVRVAYMRHVGPYGHPSIAQMWPRFAAWCAAHGLMNPRRKMYGISQDSPDVTPPEKCRYDACIEVDHKFLPTTEIGVQTIAGGRYACAPFTGPASAIHAAWMAAIDKVMNTPGLALTNRPPFELYPDDYVVDEASGVFHCLLCVAVNQA